jgi:uncharacterized protein (TIGR00251 family)
MIIHVKVKPNSSERKMINFGNNRYLIYLTSPAENNEANIELINFLSKQFTTPVKNIKIKFGMTGTEKIVDIG